MNEESQSQTSPPSILAQMTQLSQESQEERLLLNFSNEMNTSTTAASSALQSSSSLVATSSGASSIFNSISDKEWYNCTQAIKKPLPSISDSKRTLRLLYPPLWKITTSYYKIMMGENWEVPKSIKNGNDFKNKVVSYMLLSRRQRLKAQIPTHLSVFFKDSPNDRVYFYDRVEFENHIHANWKVDLNKEKETMNAQVNDIIRLFCIATAQDNRDNLESLSRAKNTTRAHADGPLSLADSIFNRWSLQFNDPDLTFKDPDRASYLESYVELDPNDTTRIKFKRDFKWIKNLYTKTLAKYNKSFKLWSKGTGGGSGAPEDYAIWDKRDDEIFANYGDNANADYLAYIYMLDKQSGFALNMVNDPPPAETVTEDGSPARTSNKNFGQQAEKLGEALKTSIKEGMQVLADAIKTSSTDERTRAAVVATTTASSIVEEMFSVDETIERLLKRKTYLESSADAASEKTQKRLKIMEDAIEKAYEVLDQLNKGGVTG